MRVFLKNNVSGTREHMADKIISKNMPNIITGINEALSGFDLKSRAFVEKYIKNLIQNTFSDFPKLSQIYEWAADDLMSPDVSPEQLALYISVWIDSAEQALKPIGFPCLLVSDITDNIISNLSYKKHKTCALLTFDIGICERVFRNKYRDFFTTMHSAGELHDAYYTSVGKALSTLFPALLVMDKCNMPIFSTISRQVAWTATSTTPALDNILYDSPMTIMAPQSINDQIFTHRDSQSIRHGWESVVGFTHRGKIYTGILETLQNQQSDLSQDYWDSVHKCAKPIIDGYKVNVRFLNNTAGKNFYRLSPDVS